MPPTTGKKCTFSELLTLRLSHETQYLGRSGQILPTFKVYIVGKENIILRKFLPDGIRTWKVFEEEILSFSWRDNKRGKLSGILRFRASITLVLSSRWGKDKKTESLVEEEIESIQGFFFTSLGTEPLAGSLCTSMVYLLQSRNDNTYI